MNVSGRNMLDTDYRLVCEPCDIISYLWGYRLSPHAASERRSVSPDEVEGGSHCVAQKSDITGGFHLRQPMILTADDPGRKRQWEKRTTRRPGRAPRLRQWDLLV